MNLTSVLIILGCLVAGYWIVSSIMSPGVDLTRAPKPDADKHSAKDGAAAPNPHERDWHLILDVPANASRRDVEAAGKRQLAKAEGSGDLVSARRIRLAIEAALRSKRG